MFALGYSRPNISMNPLSECASCLYHWTKCQCQCTYKLVENNSGFNVVPGQKSYSKGSLLDDYSFPAPFPKDLFDSFNIKSDEAYIFIGSNGTGQSQFSCKWI